MKKTTVQRMEQAAALPGQQAQGRRGAVQPDFPARPSGHTGKVISFNADSGSGTEEKRTPRFDPSAAPAEFLKFPGHEEVMHSSRAELTAMNENNHAVLRHVIACRHEAIPFFGALGVDEQQLSDMLAHAAHANISVKVATVRQKVVSPDAYLSDLYALSLTAASLWRERARLSEAVPASSGGVLLLDLRSEVRLRPTWSIELKRRVDVEQISHATLLASSGLDASNAAEAVTKISLDRVIGVIPCEDFEHFLTPRDGEESWVMKRFAAQAILGKALEAVLRLTDDQK